MMPTYMPLHCGSRGTEARICCIAFLSLLLHVVRLSGCSSVGLYCSTARHNFGLHSSGAYLHTPGQPCNLQSSIHLLALDQAHWPARHRVTMTIPSCQHTGLGTIVPVREGEGAAQSSPIRTRIPKTKGPYCIQP